MVFSLAKVVGCSGKKGEKKAGTEKVTLKLAHNLPIAHPLAKGMESLGKKVAEKEKRRPPFTTLATWLPNFLK